MSELPAWCGRVGCAHQVDAANGTWAHRWWAEPTLRAPRLGVLPTNIWRRTAVREATGAMYPYPKRAIVDLAGGLAENAAADPASRWGLGVGAALLTACYGTYCVLAQRAWVPRTRPLGIHEWQGATAVAIGLLVLCLAAVMHCHWFWSSHPRWHGFGQLGKLVAVAGVVASLGWLFYQFFFSNL